MKVMAHRGDSGKYPENTMLAFEKARQTGCHGIELDVHLSADGEAVVIHDERVDRTTDGSGWVGELSFAQLQALDASYRFRGTVAPQRIPALAQVLEWCRPTGLWLNLELKTNVCTYPGIEQKVIDQIYRAGMQQRVILSSFNHYTLLRCKKIAPQIPCGALTESWIVDFAGYLKRLGLECAHPMFPYVTQQTMAQLKQAGIRVHPWTVDQPDQMRRLIQMGVDIIITNVPDVLAQQLRQKQKPGPEQESGRAVFPAESDGTAVKPEKKTEKKAD